MIRTKELSNLTIPRLHPGFQRQPKIKPIVYVTVKRLQLVRELLMNIHRERPRRRLCHPRRRATLHAGRRPAVRGVEPCRIRSAAATERQADPSLLGASPRSPDMRRGQAGAGLAQSVTGEQPVQFARQPDGFARADRAGAGEGDAQGVAVDRRAFERAQHGRQGRFMVAAQIIPDRKGIEELRIAGLQRQGAPHGRAGPRPPA